MKYLRPAGLGWLAGTLDGDIWTFFTRMDILTASALGGERVGEGRHGAGVGCALGLSPGDVGGCGPVAGRALNVGCENVLAVAGWLLWAAAA